MARGDDWRRQLGRYLSLGVMLPAATFIGYAFGYYLDKAFGTHFFYIIFLLLGIAAGIIELIRQTTQEKL
ncbi:MAG: AtpZ/AtpI family protein [Acidobacteria bacterium]|nr:AtpZ/AtpI family protein [Acidobacteriota bacterium]